MAEGTVTVRPFISRLTTALTQRLPGAEVHTEHVRADRFRFIVVWKEFDAMDHPERQDLVWDIAERELAPHELRNVSMILTLGDEDLPQS
jgi:acid stress-induced BolA-like protein IbaG/YrbA